MVFIQNGGCLHKSAIERSASDGYHSLVISVCILHSRYPVPPFKEALFFLRCFGEADYRQAFLSGVHQSIFLRLLSQLMKHGCSGFATKALKGAMPSFMLDHIGSRLTHLYRIMLVLYLMDALRPSLAGLPPCLLDHDVDELQFYMPADEALWAATSYREWPFLLSPTQVVLGAPLQWALRAFYSGTKPISEFNHFSSLVIVTGLLKGIYECFFYFRARSISLHDQAGS